VEGGEQALTSMAAAAAAGVPFEVVFTDLQMPGMDGEMLGQCINQDPILSKSRVVLLTSMDRHGDLGRFAKMGFAGYLSKPVRRRELLACLDDVLRHDAREWHLNTQPIVTSTMKRQPDQAGFQGSVLLVEDNIVNQKVASRFLERLGCQVTIAGNGLEGVTAYAQHAFDLVLMDIQMPVMDGYTATARIRELQAGRIRVPVIALTANAMKGQLEECLAAGMDALLTKPIDVDRLQETLRRVGLAKALQASPSATAGESAPAAVDFVSLRALTGEDPEFMAELAHTFESNSRELVAQMHATAARGDFERLAAAAHQLKGSSGNLHSTVLHQLCATLQSEAQAAHAASVAQTLALVTAELDRVCAALASLVDPPQRRAGGANP
jgi:CheY-like chemotaxis protein/HPt (histidine-containing phosphotransfer) domain-containing protein